MESTETWSEKRKQIAEHIERHGVDRHREWGIVRQLVNTDYKPHKAFLRFYEEHIGPISAVDSIVEAGPGIGTLASVIYASGFKGKYTSFDFPEMQTIQQYALGGYDVEYVNTVDELPKAAGLFIASFSVEEMPAELRFNLMDRASGYGSHLLQFNGPIRIFFSLVDRHKGWLNSGNKWAR